MSSERLPTPEQMHTWLRAHGWTPETPISTDPADGVVYIYKEHSDDGQEIWIVAPTSVEATPRYPLSVRDIVVTAAGMEERPEAEVLAEMLAIDVTPSPRTPPQPVP
jgi:hypothetical protein